MGWLKRLGPGLVTGAADDDPSGIGTYAQAGAQFGFQYLWAMLFTFPLMSAIQAIAARVGRATGAGLTTNVRKLYPAWLAIAAIGALGVANAINIGADIVAMGAGASLVAGGPSWAWAVGLALLTLVAQVFVPYHLYVRYLKWLTLSLLAYVAVAFVSHAPWGEVARSTFVPHVGSSKEELTILIAILGTTISPYLFFWQSSEEVEDMAEKGKRPLVEATRPEARRALRRIGVDTIVGMLASNVISFCIILSAAATLHAHGQTNIASAQQAAEALRPIAGPLTFALFALGLVGTGLLAVPVLAGSVAYACAECFGWKASLEAQVWKAPRFYAVIAGAILAGLAILVLRIDPMSALVWTAVINGIASVPIMALVVRLASRRDVLKEHAIPGWLQAVGWLTTAAMALAAAGMLWTTFA